jgi:hypothetical protein
MDKRRLGLTYLMLGLVALWFIPPVANAQVTVTSVKVTVANAGDTATYCDTSLACGSGGTGGIQVWTLPAGGQPVGVGQTLVLTQTGVISGLGGNFDTSDQIRSNTGGFGGPYLKGCTALAPCTVTVTINGTQVYNSASPSALNGSNSDNNSNEFSPWALAATETGYTLKLAYADNAHPSGGGFPNPFNGTNGTTSATFFYGQAAGAVYDGGALLITGVQASTFTGCTVTQGGWGSKPHGNNPGAFLAAHFPAAGVIIGLGYPNPVGPPFWLKFDSAVDIQNFLPQGTGPGALSASALDPTLTTTAGVFAGQVLALTLNVELEGFGSLVLSGTGTSLDGKTVTQVLAAANLAISGGALPAGFTYSLLNDLVDNLNGSFDNCQADGFAIAHLH